MLKSLTYLLLIFVFNYINSEYILVYNYFTDTSCSLLSNIIATPINSCGIGVNNNTEYNCINNEPYKMIYYDKCSTGNLTQKVALQTDCTIDSSNLNNYSNYFSCSNIPDNSVIRYDYMGSICLSNETYLITVFPIDQCLSVNLNQFQKYDCTNNQVTIQTFNDQTCTGTAQKKETLSSGCQQQELKFFSYSCNQQNNNNNTGFLAGLIIGFFIMIGILIFLWIFYQRKYVFGRKLCVNLCNDNKPIKCIKVDDSLQLSFQMIFIYRTLGTLLLLFSLIDFSLSLSIRYNITNNIYYY